jgi:hypothetical protein
MAALLEVEKIADLMESYPGTTILLTGRADATGDPGYNMILSHQRVDRVAQYLEERGIRPGRITREARGESDPVARDRYPDGREAPLGRYLNRQVTALITSPEPITAALSGFYVPASLQLDPGNDPAARDVTSGEDVDTRFTIQIYADYTPVDITKFKGVTGVTEYACKDGYYRYAVGFHGDYPEARQALAVLRESGYPDAFIQTVDWYRKASR